MEHTRPPEQWNATEAAFAEASCIHEVVADQAARTPDALAVSFGGRTLSYAELDRGANRLAHALQRLGVGPEVRVGVCLDRTPQLIVALLAVLKAGGAYVPLDPAYPEERLAFMLRDAGAPVLVTDDHLLARFPVLGTTTLLRMDGDASGPISEPTTPPRSTVHPANVAYVIYTSGSTGLPKGVQIHHHSLMNLVAWHQREYQLTPADRATQIAGLGFDASVWEIWPYLASGASLHLPDHDVYASPRQLVNWLVRQEISLSFVPTPLAELLLDEPWPPQVKLRALLTGGDRLHRQPPDDLPFALVNHYGPTENTVVTTWGRVDAAATAEAPPPIGRPIANTQVYVLDEHGQPVPIGVPGELFIGGVQVARGYLGRPRLTAERFAPDPFSSTPGARLYRTGDRVRWRAEGTLEFLGRLDHQVKLRGFRIELGEIEAALSQHPAVREAVVVLRTDAASGPHLVAYFTCHPATQPSAADLRRHLSQRLPEYMLPSRYVALARLPLSPNGKLDRAALPAPTADPDEHQREHVPPRTPTEVLLVGLWAELLGLAQVGMHDHFFELGGHSLLATQLLSRVRELFQVELPLRTLFEAPTPATLAEAIDERKDSGPEHRAPSIDLRPVSRAAFRVSRSALRHS
jgi:amino acid adenylation domain-containing protein